MWWLKFISYFASLMIPGLCLVWFLRPDQRRFSALNFFLAYGLGSSFIAIILFFYFFIFRGSYSYLLFWLVWGLIALLGLLVPLPAIKKHSRIVIKWFKPQLTKLQSAVVAVVFLFSLINIGFLVSDAAVRPTALYDSLAMWSFKAKVLFYDQAINFDPTQEFYLGGGSHINYPWQIPLLQYWLQVNLGTYDDLATNWIFVGYFLSLLGLVFCVLRKYAGFFRAVIFSFFLFSSPLVFYHGFNAYADLPLALYITAAIAFFYAWLNDKRSESLNLSAVFWGLSFWVKDGAWFLFLPFLLLLSVYSFKRYLPRWEGLKFLLVTLVVASPWLFFRQFYHLGLSNTSPGLVFKPEILLSFLEAMFVGYSWNLWWFFVLIALFFNFKRIISSVPLVFLWSFIGLGFLSLILLYLLTFNYQYALDQTALSRTLLSLVGVVFLAVGLSFEQSGSDY